MVRPTSQNAPILAQVLVPKTLKAMESVGALIAVKTAPTKAAVRCSPGGVGLSRSGPLSNHLFGFDGAEFSANDEECAEQTKAGSAGPHYQAIEYTEAEQAEAAVVEPGEFFDRAA